MFTDEQSTQPLLDNYDTCRKNLKTNHHQNSWKKSHLKKYIICCAGVFMLGFVLCLYVLQESPEFNQYAILKRYKSKNQQSQTKTILLWSYFFGDKNWKLPNGILGPSEFRNDLKCPVYNCELSNRHDNLSSVLLYDAVVFHTAEPFIDIYETIPLVRSSHQAYVFALMEPPGETRHLLSSEGGFYNLTMTYRLDSDVVWPYKYIIDIETGKRVAPAKRPYWRKAPVSWNNTEVWNAWKGKTKMAAWFVSHCDTLSKREKLVKAIQNYIPVDIYGKCGPLSCEQYSPKCDDMLDEDYMFYIAFENSLCTDYVTEKLFNVLKRNIIPVVYGGANYTRFLPPKSYIDAEQFKTVKDLAAYLKYLSQSPEEYVKYFWWRQYYKLGNYSPFCDLCEILNSSTYQKKSQTYTDIEEWWLGNSCRFESKLEF